MIRGQARKLAIVGFDNTNIATTIWLQLTTVRQPIKNMAIAADLLIEEIKAETLFDIKVKKHRTLDYMIIAGSRFFIVDDISIIF